MNPTDPTTPISDERKAEVLAAFEQAQKWDDLAFDVARDLRSLAHQNLLSPEQYVRVVDMLYDDELTENDNPPLSDEQKKYRKGYTDGVLGALLKGVTLEEAYDWRYSRDPSEYPSSHSE